MPYRILIDSEAISGIALYSINNTILDFLNDSYMIGFSVLQTWRAFGVPIEKDNDTGRGS